MTDAVRHPGRRRGDKPASDPADLADSTTIERDTVRAEDVPAGDDAPANEERAHEKLARAAAHNENLTPEPQFEESIVDDVSNLIDDGLTYAQAEIGFQKTRASAAAKSAGYAAGYAIVALVTLHIALLALAVGLVIALAPLVTIWGAIAIVVGALFLLTAWLGLKARGRAERISAMFAEDEERGEA